MTSLGIVVLAFNEVASLEETVDIINSNDHAKAEIIISLSTNGLKECNAMAEKLSLENQNVRVYYQKNPFVAAAVIEATHELKTDLIIYMSADRETPPEIIPLMLHAYLEGGFNIISTSRWIKGGSFSGYGRMKWLVSRMTQLVCQLLYPSPLTEFTYGYRLYERNLLANSNFRESKHPFFLESLLVPLRLGAKVKEVPVNWKPRVEGVSVVTLPVLISYLRPLIRTRFTRRKFLTNQVPRKSL